MLFPIDEVEFEAQSLLTCEDSFEDPPLRPRTLTFPEVYDHGDYLRDVWPILDRYALAPHWEWRRRGFSLSFDTADSLVLMKTAYEGRTTG